MATLNMFLFHCVSKYLGKNHFDHWQLTNSKLGTVVPSVGPRTLNKCGVWTKYLVSTKRSGLIMQHIICIGPKQQPP